MNWNKNIIAVFLLLFVSCSESLVDFGEQYKKTLYIVNSKDMLYIGKQSYGIKDNTMDFSVYCSSTKPIKSDLSVTLKIDPKALDSLNKKSALGNPLYVDIQMLPEANYKAGDLKITIKKNEQYGVLKIGLDMEGLNPDIAYALPLSIVSNSDDLDVNPEMNTIVYQVQAVNGFSGSFTGSSIELPGTIRSVSPILSALSANTVRMPIHTLPAEKEFFNTNYMVLTIAGDSTSVSIKPWANAIVTDLGNSTYDKKRQHFTLNYSFTDNEGKVFTIKEKIVNIDAPPIDDEGEEEEI